MKEADREASVWTIGPLGSRSAMPTNESLIDECEFLLLVLLMPGFHRASLFFFFCSIHVKTNGLLLELFLINMYIHDKEKEKTISCKLINYFLEKKIHIKI